MPNLASEVLVPWLARLTGLVTATKLFLTAGIVMWVMGPGMIHRALYGRTGISPLFGAVFAYNANFIWGFFNYYFSAGLSLRRLRRLDRHRRQAGAVAAGGLHRWP